MQLRNISKKGAPSMFTLEGGEKKEKAYKSSGIGLF